MFYPKIDTLFIRGDNHKVTDEYRHPEFGYIDSWLWMEKLDGMNISIISDIHGTEWRGRTEKSQFTREVQDHLEMLCEKWHSTLQQKLDEYKLDTIEIFGEIIGPKIQNGGIYSDKITTRFYDVRVDKRLWLDWDQVIDYSHDLEFTKPTYGVNFRDTLVNYVREGFNTYEGQRDAPAEGIVCKTWVPLYNNNGNRVIWKLKTKDFA